MRLVHLTRASSEKAIVRNGISGEHTLLHSADPQKPIEIKHAVFAMPVLADFSTTYQWLRELRRWHDERMVAVHFRIADSENVYLGRYNGAHEKGSVSTAALWVRNNPAGAQIVVPRSVSASEVAGIRTVPQLVGWTEVPVGESRSTCVCEACVPNGARNLMRCLRGAVADVMVKVSQAKSDDEVTTLLQQLHTPYERARGRIEPDKLLPFVRSGSDAVREVSAALLSYFSAEKVEPSLRQMLADPAANVRQAALNSTMRVLGLRRTSTLASDFPESLLVQFVESIGYESDEALARSLLNDYANHPSVRVRAAADAGIAWLADE